MFEMYEIKDWFKLSQQHYRLWKNYVENRTHKTALPLQEIYQSVIYRMQDQLYKKSKKNKNILRLKTFKK